MILLIDNYDSFTYNLYQKLAELGAKVQVVRNDKITLTEIKDLNPSGIVLSPGPGRPEDAGICVELIRDFIDQENASIPLLGVCLGHQAIGIALQGKVVQADDIFHGKSDLIFHQGKGLYQKLPLPFKAARYHSLVVDKVSLPPELSIEAENGQGIVMGMRHKTLPIYGVQFHPESLLTPQGNQLLQAFVTLKRG